MSFPFTPFSIIKRASQLEFNGDDRGNRRRLALNEANVRVFFLRVGVGPGTTRFSYRNRHIGNITARAKCTLNCGNVSFSNSAILGRPRGINTVSYSYTENTSINVCIRGGDVEVFFCRLYMVTSLYHGTITLFFNLY